MTQPVSRYAAPSPAAGRDGWTVSRLTPPSRLFGANGMRVGPDGRIYVAQVSGSQVSAIDVATGAVEAYVPKGGAIVAPDDIVFDDEGNLYATEITEGRIGMVAPNGASRIIYGDSPVANPITFHQGRLISGECRPGGRIMELSREGGAPRMILEDVPLPNAFTVGPDGKLYFPVMGTNEIWRVALDGGAPEIVAKDLGTPDSVKFDAQGFIISTQVYSGQVLRIDPRNGDRTVLAQLTPGLDNCVLLGERLFVSNISGYIVEVLKDGATKDLVPDGFNWPMGLAPLADGSLYVADGAFCHFLHADGRREQAGMLFSPGFPGYSRGVALAANGAILTTTANGAVARYWPREQRSEVIADGFDQLYGIAEGSGGAVVFAEMGAGRIHAARGGTVDLLIDGLDRPKGVALDADGTVYVSESGAGRVIKLSGGRAEVVADGLADPQGILVHDGGLFIVDAGDKTLSRFDLARRTRDVLAADLPVGAPIGVVPKAIGPITGMSGPMGPFADVVAGADGTLFVSGDAEGSVLAIRRG